MLAGRYLPRKRPPSPPDWQLQTGMSDTSIAEHVGVSQPFVGKLRKVLEEDGSLITVISRQGRDGRTTDTSNIVAI